MDKEILKQKLVDEGFLYVYDWQDKPEVEYKAHSHKGKVSMFILEGGLIISFDDGEIKLKAGDQFDVPVGKEHTAKVGSNGCLYIVGEMIEGDS